jgi:hypothetical protein
MKTDVNFIPREMIDKMNSTDPKKHKSFSLGKLMVAADRNEERFDAKEKSFDDEAEKTAEEMISILKKKFVGKNVEGYGLIENFRCHPEYKNYNNIQVKVKGHDWFTLDKNYTYGKKWDRIKEKWVNTEAEDDPIEKVILKFERFKDNATEKNQEYYKQYRKKYNGHYGSKGDVYGQNEHSRYFNESLEESYFDY